MLLKSRREEGQEAQMKLYTTAPYFLICWQWPGLVYVMFEVERTKVRSCELGIF